MTLTSGTVGMHRMSRRFLDETGTALIIVLIGLSLFSLLGLFMTLNATTGLRISDNYESQLQATYAALAGLNHARALLHGLDFDDLLKGPDGAYSQSPSYLAQAKGFGFRNLFPLTTAHSLNIFNPASDVLGIPDDGLINTGFYSGANGTIIIPITGICQTAPNPHGGAAIVTSRYFVKITDNNGDASEKAGDPGDNPFIDGDGIVIVRSIGIARTLADFTGSVQRNNSVAIFEMRLKRSSVFDMGPALVVQGSQILSSFDETYEISGGVFPGIGTIDTDVGDAALPDQIIRSSISSGGNITGGGLPHPSIQDFTGQVSSNADRAFVLKPQYLWDFIHRDAPRIADNFYNGDQYWTEGSAPFMGSYDPTKPRNAPGQDPKLLVVNGNLQLMGNLSGGGLLIVTGDFSCVGPYAYSGLVLVIGSGHMIAQGSGKGISGGLFVANLTDAGEGLRFGTPSISIGGNSQFIADKNAVRMALGLIPATQISFREIAGSDP